MRKPKPIYRELVEKLGLDHRLPEIMAEPAVSKALAHLYAEAAELLPSFDVETDHSPVMRSPGAFAAKLSHAQKCIVLNGALIETFENPSEVREFLTFHELGHALIQNPLSGTDLDHEGCCDLLGLYAMDINQHEAPEVQELSATV